MINTENLGIASAPDSEYYRSDPCIWLGCARYRLGLVLMPWTQGVANSFCDIELLLYALSGSKKRQLLLLIQLRCHLSVRVDSNAQVPNSLCTNVVDAFDVESAVTIYMTLASFRLFFVYSPDAPFAAVTLVCDQEFPNVHCISSFVHRIVAPKSSLCCSIHALHGYGRV
jgi:hypothetical protein